MHAHAHIHRHRHRQTQTDRHTHAHTCICVCIKDVPDALVLPNVMHAPDFMLLSTQAHMAPGSGSWNLAHDTCLHTPAQLYILFIESSVSSVSCISCFPSVHSLEMYPVGSRSLPTCPRSWAIWYAYAAGKRSDWWWLLFQVQMRYIAAGQRLWNQI